MGSVTTTDPKWERPDSYNAAERFMLTFMKDERDMIFIRTAAVMCATVLPFAATLFFLPSQWVWWLALPYLGFTFGVFGGRYGLMLHANGHRPVFTREYNVLNYFVPFVLGPFLGHTPTSFGAHHLGMHHADGNMLPDHSSTLPYRRDHFGDFLHYWARFFLTGVPHLFRYLMNRDKPKTAWSFLRGEVAWFVVASLAVWVNPAAGMVVFVIPLVMMRWLLMSGNWGQHAFVDIDDADNPYRNSHNLTNTYFNHMAYNDGYHIVHHLYPGMHWSEMAAWYEDNYDRFVEEDAIIFDGIMDNIALWFLLMFRRYDYMASRMVNTRGRSHEELVALLKSRARRTMGEKPAFFTMETREDVAAAMAQQAA